MDSLQNTKEGISKLVKVKKLQIIDPLEENYCNILN